MVDSSGMYKNNKVIKLLHNHIKSLKLKEKTESA